MTQLLERIVVHGLHAAEVADIESIRLIVRRLVANAFAAGNSEITRALAPAMGQGRCTALSWGTRAESSGQAAAANAAAITITQCDEGLREARGHPGLHAFAAAFAVVEESGGTVGDLLTATAAGWEVGSRLGLALGPVKAGVHPHGGWGVGAAAAAAAVAMGFDHATTARAVANALTVGLAGPDASTYAGQDSHHLLSALGVSNGVTVARLTEAGLTPPSGAFDHFAALVHGLEPGEVGTWDGDAPLLASAYFKPIGLCAHALTSWESSVRLSSRVEIQEVERMTVRTYGAAARLADRSPSSRLGRQFSIPWAVASGLASKDPETDGGAEVAALAQVTEVEHDPDLDSRYPAARPAYVTVHRLDGSVVEEFAEFHRGDRERPFTASEHDAINSRLLARASDPSWARRVYSDMVDDSLRLHEITSQR